MTPFCSLQYDWRFSGNFWLRNLYHGHWCFWLTLNWFASYSGFQTCLVRTCIIKQKKTAVKQKSAYLSLIIQKIFIWNMAYQNLWYRHSQIDHTNGVLNSHYQCDLYVDSWIGYIIYYPVLRNSVKFLYVWMK